MKNAQNQYNQGKQGGDVTGLNLGENGLPQDAKNLDKMFMP
jgi:hypothetical protein